MIDLIGRCKLQTSQGRVHYISHREVYITDLIGRCTLYTSQGGVHYRPHREVYIIGLIGKCTLYTSQGSVHYIPHREVYIIYLIGKCTLYTSQGSVHYISHREVYIIYLIGKCTLPVKKELKYTSQVRYGLETLSHLGPKIWSTIPDELQSLITVESFKKSIRKWKPTKCPCNLCKIYVAGSWLGGIKLVKPS